MHIKLKTILEQSEAGSPYYDVSKDFNAFVQADETQTEQLRQRFSQAIEQKLKGKRIRARASVGFKQFIKDYDFDVVNVRIEDYYNEYVIIAHGFDGRRERDFFIVPKFKVQILGPAKEHQPQPATHQPEKQPPVQPPTKPVSQPQPAQSAQQPPKEG
jgi:hypothetical protein